MYVIWCRYEYKSKKKVFICNVFFSAKGEIMDISESPDTDPSADVAIKLGSRVVVNLANGASFATVRWIGSLPNMSSKMAGLELVLINPKLFW